MTTALTLVRPPDSPVSRPGDHEIVQLGEAIAELAARLHAATYELLVRLHEFDDRAGWNTGFTSCAHWLSWRIGIDLGAAREKVRVARALATLPRISTALQRGEISYAKVRAISRIATPANEAHLLDVALAGTAAHVERIVRAWRRIDDVVAARQTERRHLTRQLTTWVDEDGMLVIRGRLTPEAGAVVQRALDAAADRLFQAPREAPRGDTLSSEVTAAQRRADALERLAECALAGGLDRGTAGDRYQVVVHVDAAALQETNSTSRSESGQAVVELGDGGVGLSAETAHRLACDAGVVVMRHRAEGSVLDVGRKRRTIPPAIRRALAARDRHCRFPGCAARRCEAHHVRFWSAGGATQLHNLVNLCKLHHRAVHELGFRVIRGSDEEVTFFRPDGTRIDAAPPPPRWSEPHDHALAPTTRRLAQAGIVITARTGAPRWAGERWIWAGRSTCCIRVQRDRFRAVRTAPWIVSARAAGPARCTGRGPPTADPVPVADGVNYPNLIWAGHFAIAANGTLAFWPGAGDAKRQLVWVDRQGRQQPIAANPRGYAYPRVSPDGTRIAVNSLDEEYDVWVFDLEKETLTRLTSGPASDTAPAWTPDGRRVLFSSVILFTVQRARFKAAAFQAVSFQPVRSDRQLRAGRARWTSGTTGPAYEETTARRRRGRDFQSRAESTAFQAVVSSSGYSAGYLPAGRRRNGHT